MNRLRTEFFRGMGFELDDIRFEQEAVREAFFGLLSAFGIAADESFIISGCEVTGTVPNLAINAGYIALGGEIYKVAASPLPVGNPGDVYYFDIEVSYDPTGTEVTEGGTTEETYEIRRAIVAIGLPPGIYMPLLAERLSFKIAKMADLHLNGINWTTRILQPVPPFSAPVPGQPFLGQFFVAGAGQAPHYKTDSCGNVHISGTINCPATPDQTIMVLSNDLIPARNVAAVAIVYNAVGTFQEVVPLVIQFPTGGTGWELRFASASHMPGVGDFAEFNFSYPKL